MATRYHIPRYHKTAISVPYVVGDTPLYQNSTKRRRNTAHRNAKRLKQRPTAAEQRLEQILNELKGGVLKGKFLTQYVVADKWILDFFFYENRLGIEVDGDVHNNLKQIQRDTNKARTCRDWDITLIRFKNKEVFGDRNELLNKLREGWRKADERIKGSRFAFRKKPG